jgi:hypothetical protein
MTREQPCFWVLLTIRQVCVVFILACESVYRHFEGCAQSL